MATAYGHVSMILDVYLPLRWQLGVEGWQETIEVFVGQPMRLLRAIQAHFERTARELTPILTDPETEKQAYHATNRMMQPLLRKYGYRSLKQFRAAYDELGTAMPWPRKRVAKS